MKKTVMITLVLVAAATLRSTGGSETEQIYDVDVHTELCGLLSGLNIRYQIAERGGLNYWIPFETFVPKESKEPAPPRGP